MFRRLTHLLTLVLAIGCATACTAQAAAATAQSPTIPKGRYAEHWPSPDLYKQTHNLDLITTAQPGIVHHCRVHAISDDALTCGDGFARKPIVYQRADIATFINPIHHHVIVIARNVTLLLGACVGVALLGPVADVIVLTGVLVVLLLATGIL